MSETTPGRRRPHLVVAAAVCVMLLVAGAFLVRHLVACPFTVPSASMEPTLQPGDLILADRTTRGTAQRGAIVVFDGAGYFGPTQSGSRYWVKRVIAVGGDTIRCCSTTGRLVLNGEELKEPYLAPGTEPSTVRFDLEVPSGRMFVLGDNRSDSTDSRHMLGAPGGGMVPVERVVGEVDRVIWPLERAGVR